jgi:hypothetical protein
LRPGQFNGVQVIGGTHSDAFRSSTLFGLTQVIVGVGTGFSAPENVEAVQTLAQGYLTDMFAGTVYDEGATRAGYYGELGSVIDIPTSTGVDAHAYVLPGPAPQLSPIDLLTKAFLESLDSTGFATCAASSPHALPATDPVLLSLNTTRHSTVNKALSLDVTSRKGQSVGQQCVNE